jgi:hypothetical protein
MQTVQLDKRFSYGLGDAVEQDYVYFIEANTNALFMADASHFAQAKTPNEIDYIDTGVSLPAHFYHVKVDAGILYFVKTDSSIEYLHQISLANPNVVTKTRLSEFSSYDVSSGNIMASAVQTRQGNVFRTVL